MPYDAATIQVGAKDPPPDAVEMSAQGILLLRQTSPDAMITLWVDGYDDDPRELWDIPEVCEQVKQVIYMILRAKPEWSLDDLKLHPYSVCLVGMCLGILHITGCNPKNGNYIMEVRGDIKAALQPR